MTAKTESLQEFYWRVVGFVGGTETLHHWPNNKCFDGECTVRKQRCKYKPFLNLTAWFLKYGPDVNSSWRNFAKVYRFDPDEVHEVLIGALIGGDRRPVAWTWSTTIQEIPDSVWDSAHKRIPYTQ